MKRHLSANLWLLVLTVAICCGLYPLVLWAIGQTAFRQQADGSLLTEDGKVIGSRLIAQPFNGDEYFKPRPSAPSYDASASGASNWGANNPLLRDRVAQALGPMVKYGSGPRKGDAVGPDVEQWFIEQVEVDEDFVPKWAEAHATVAEQWIKNNAEAVGAWLGKDADAVKKESGDILKTFFKDYAAREPGTWPCVEDVEIEKDKTARRIKPATTGTDIQANLFDVWLQDHKQEAAQIEQVPADRVMASGSGLDPHITLKNAESQLADVATAWAKKTGTDEGKVREQIKSILQKHAEAPLGGLAGVKLVNVLEVNRALKKQFGNKTTATR